MYVKCVRSGYHLCVHRISIPLIHHVILILVVTPHLSFSQITTNGKLDVELNNLLVEATYISFKFDDLPGNSDLPTIRSDAQPMNKVGYCGMHTFKSNIQYLKTIPLQAFSYRIIHMDIIDY